MIDPLTPPAAPDLPQRVAALTEASDRLAEKVERLTPRVEDAERVSRRAALGAIVLVCLVLVLFWVAASQRATARAQDDLIQQVECPFYALILGSYDPATRKPGVDRDKYEAAFAEMRQLRDHLGCTGDLVPKRQDG